MLNEDMEFHDVLQELSGTIPEPRKKVEGNWDMRASGVMVGPCGQPSSSEAGIPETMQKGGPKTTLGLGTRIRGRKGVGIGTGNCIGIGKGYRVR